MGFTAFSPSYRKLVELMALRFEGLLPFVPDQLDFSVICGTRS